MGRTAIFMVIGFSMISLYFGSQSYDVKFETMNNAMTYYENVQRTSIGSAGANFAMTKLTSDTSWKGPGINVKYPFAGGTFAIEVRDSIYALTQYKVVYVETIYQGSNLDGSGTNITGYTKIVLSPSSFSKFGYFSANDPSTITWQTGDTVFGPFHSNTYIYISATNSIDQPVFMDKATSRNGLNPSTGSRPVFKKGHYFPVNITMPSFASAFQAIKNAAKDNGHYDSAGRRNSPKWFNGTPWWKSSPGASVLDGNYDTVFLNFRSNGYLRIGLSSTYASRSDSLKDTLLSTFAPNGVMFFERMIVKVQGRVNGKYTIAAAKVGTVGGTIIIDSSIAYVDTTTLGVSTSDDMLGLVASDSITIAYNANNNPLSGVQRGVDVHAVVFSLYNGFGAANYSIRPNNGQIRLFGGICQAKRQPVGTTAPSGFHKSYHHDPRLLRRIVPPLFPKTGVFEILSWFE
ncbi:MAG: hypothetical protein Q8L88_09685 [Bacteroidota bacterium]|nr:hypothetical protein [Bacteroidota bacterium]